ncbi:gfo/Idh/MocA family oxidoreductase [Lactobacillus amylolyticus]|uniref:Oxidoreductase, NAD-binding domain protein n=1 Tax=Lactobacillus amylolyticus DSM 11664 TaxID=585524 RepID=D4YRH0_9LACO|nr:Gfo/Idh/MocA family oxidoreductase [Lactobacillus amylolyticus]EFG56280.1 oxidoreductase, NAD-binding domain protein [Lactobacillus amylolyticus DSM 11664]KRL19120.1 gfo Idh MocA family oxidoreductase [Lactobacillus amylolyticus DSM 11664]QFY03862.1 gfo/Idh/MocA family oxidoreductase [Lactobacillus amylolyticus]TDG63538.1 hypothetical protein C5L18_000617 [Lactobacillus amylolyticus]
MKLLIAGSGKIVQDWLTITPDLPQIELSGITATKHSLERMQEMAKKYGIKKVFTDYDQALAECDADTVYVAVINSLHYSFAKKALEAGKNVICEKPFTVSFDEFEELKNLALEKDLVLIEAITNLYLPNYKLLQEKLPELGKIRIVSMNYSQYSSRYDKFKEGIIAPVFDPKKAGGALMDLNVYNIHLLVGLFGMPKKVQYLANMQRGVDTSGILLLDYGDFKAVSIAAKDVGAPVTSTIEGENESIVIDGPTNTFPAFDTYHNSEKLEHFNVNDHDHRMFDEFVEFDRIIKDHDMEKIKAALKHSEQVMKVIDLARK